MGNFRLIGEGVDLLQKFELIGESLRMNDGLEPDQVGQGQLNSGTSLNPYDEKTGPDYDGTVRIVEGQQKTHGTSFQREPNYIRLASHAGCFVAGSYLGYNAANELFDRRLDTHKHHDTGTGMLFSQALISGALLALELFEDRNIHPYGEAMLDIFAYGCWGQIGFGAYYTGHSKEINFINYPSTNNEPSPQKRPTGALDSSGNVGGRGD